MNYTRQDILNFLTVLDSEIKQQMEIIIIGGASLSLAYNFSNMTVDVDLYNLITDDLRDAIQRAKNKSHIGIKISTTHVRAEIKNLEERLFTPDSLKYLKKLIIKIPERHDLALMKAARNEPRDLEDIQGLHSRYPLESKILLERFKYEVLPLVAGSDELAKSRFLEMIESLFGTESADDFEKEL